MVIELSDVLKIADNTLPRAFEEYQQYIGDPKLIFQSPGRLELTPHKNYTARIDVPLQYNSRNAGKVTVILFSRGDATGEQSERYNLTNVSVPFPLHESERGKLEPTSLIPRSKQGIHEEVLFPFFTIYGGDVFSNAVCLDELALRTNSEKKMRVSVSAHLGMPSIEEFNKYLLERHNQMSPLPPKIQYTLGYDGGTRLGDPHAIMYPSLGMLRETYQIVGFLTMKDPDDPLINVIEPKSEWPFWDFRNLFTPSS